MATDEETFAIQLEARIREWERQLARAAGTWDKKARQIERRQKAMERRFQRGFQNIGRNLVPALSGVAAALSTREIIRYGDAWTTAGNKISAAGTPLEERATRLKQLADLAVDTRGAFDETTTTFARLERSTQSLGKSEEELLKITGTINKAFVVGGAAASEQAAGILQLTQAIASGYLQGDELRSVRENAPVIAQEIANVMGTTLGGLKQLGAEGKITTEKIVQALEQLGPKVEAQFARTQVTVGQALQNLETRFTQFVGGLSENGSLGVLAGGIDMLADHLDDLAKAAGIAAAALAPAGIAAAARLATTAVGVLTAAVAANPLGALVVVSSAAAAALVLYGNEIYGLRDASNAYLAVAKKVKDIDEQLKNATGKRVDALLDEREALLDNAKAELAYLKAKLASQRALSHSTGRAGMAARGHLAYGRGEEMAAEIALLEAHLADMEAGTGGRRRPRARTDRGAAPKTEPSTTQKSKPYDTAVANIKKQTAALIAQTEAQDRSTYAQEAAAKASNLLDAARRQGLKVTPALIKEVNGLAAAYAQAKAEQGVEDALAGTEDKIRALQLETQAMGKTQAAADTLRFREELLNEVRKAGIPLTEELANRIRSSVDAYGAAAEAAEDEARVIQKQIQLADEARDSVTRIGVAGVRGFNNLGDAASQAALRFAEMVVQLRVMEPLVRSLFGAQGTGLGGLVGSLFGGGGGAGAAASTAGYTFGPMAFADGGVMTPSGPMQLPRYASGGVSRGPAIFGEAGPEAAVPLPDGRRIPVQMLNAAAMSRPAAGTQVNIINNAPNTQIREERGKGPNGQDLVNVVIDATRRNYAQGGFDKANQGRFGALPTKVLR